MIFQMTEPAGLFTLLNMTEAPRMDVQLYNGSSQNFAPRDEIGAPQFGQLMPSALSDSFSTISRFWI